MGLKSLIVVPKLSVKVIFPKEKYLKEVKKSDDQCGILAVRAFETIKKVLDNSIVETLDRNAIWLAQTPQLAKFNNLEQAFDNSPNVGITEVKKGKFEFKISMPNSYYAGLGSLYIAPNVNSKLF